MSVPPPPRSTLFPYTTLFRSVVNRDVGPFPSVAPIHVVTDQHQGPAIIVEDGGINRPIAAVRSEEHTSELQSLRHLVCRLLLEKKKTLAQRPTCTTRHRSTRV